MQKIMSNQIEVRVANCYAGNFTANLPLSETARRVDSVDSRKSGSCFAKANRLWDEQTSAFSFHFSIVTCSFATLVPHRGLAPQNKPELQKVLEKRKRDQVLKAQKEDQEAHKKRSDLEIELMKRQQKLEQVNGGKP